MWTPEAVQLKSAITIVVKLKFGLPKSRFTVMWWLAAFTNLTVEETDTKG